MIGEHFSGGFPRKKGEQGSPGKLPSQENQSVTPTVMKRPTDITVPITQAVQPITTGDIALGKFDVPQKVEEPIIAEALWQGPMYGFSGYAKSNREIIFRAAKQKAKIRVWQDPKDPIWEQRDISKEMEARLVEQGQVEISDRAPFVRFFGPRVETIRRYRVIYTMMETELVHSDMVRLINHNYQECWVPTFWNKGTFEHSGVKIPIHVMPLGVDATIYRPDGPAEMPAATLLTTRHAGLVEPPKGFVFVYVFQTGFRKGIEILCDAFEEAFAREPDVALILATTFGPLKHHTVKEPGPSFRSRIYWLSGAITEEKIAAMYRACNGYVCTSLGEGWNLPMCEAAACGLPVAVPRTTVHPELVDDTKAFLFDAEGYVTRQDAESISPWYKGIPFPVHGPASIKDLAFILGQIRWDTRLTMERAAAFGSEVRTRWTWDGAAAKVVERLNEIMAGNA